MGWGCLLVYWFMDVWDAERSFSMKGLLSVHFCRSVTSRGQRILGARGERGVLPVFFVCFSYQMRVPSCDRNWILIHNPKATEWVLSLPKGYRFM